MSKAVNPAKAVAFYARISTEGQEHSPDGQLHDLREQLAGMEIVREVVDRGEKRHTLQRPGIEELYELASNGEIDEIWAWAWDRYGQAPWPEVLAAEMDYHGVSLRALDDGGEGEAGELLRMVMGWKSKQEQKDRVRRMNRGKQDKARDEGEIMGGTPKPRYGFDRVRNDKGTVVGYAVNEEMGIVRRIFEAIAEGKGYRTVARELEQDGIIAPSKETYQWSKTTLKRIIDDDIYRSIPYEEIVELVSPKVAAKLEPGESYGISWYGQRKSYYTGEGKKRNYTYTDPSEWIAVPVPDSGIPREVVDRARDKVAGNVSRTRAEDNTKYYELTGILRCAECGRKMLAYRRAKRYEGYNHYYRCRPSASADRSVVNELSSTP